MFMLNVECFLYKENQYLFCVNIIVQDIQSLLQDFGMLLPNAKIMQIYSSQVEKAYQIIIYGYLENPEISSPAVEPQFIKSSKESLLKYAVDNTVTFQLSKNYIIKDDIYPIMQHHNPLRGNRKPATFMSGDWFNRIINDLAYTITNRDNLIGNAIGNAGMYSGMKIAQDIITIHYQKKTGVFPKNQVNYTKLKQDSGLARVSPNSMLDLENEALKTLFIKVFKAYGYADIEGINNILNGADIVGYKVTVKSHIFLYTDDCDKRDFLVKRANGPRGFTRRNCFFFRDLLKGVIEYLNEDIDEKTFIPLESKYLAMEYELYHENDNLFTNANINRVQGQFEHRGNFDRHDTCAYLTERPDCTFYFFEKSFLYA
jgi:hypothetical protein